MIKFLLLFSSLLSLSDRYVCTCLQSSIEESIEGSNMIFIGKVLKVDTIKAIPEWIVGPDFAASDSESFITQHLVTLKMKKVYKGENQTDTMYVMTGQGGGDCGYYFKLQSDYLVYAYKQQYFLFESVKDVNSIFIPHKAAYLTTSDCHRTTISITTEEKLLKAALLNKK